MPPIPTEEILGYNVVASGPGLCVDAIASWTRGGTGARWLACLNPHSYAVALRSDRFRRALSDADWLVADGVGVVLASRLLGGRIPGRTTGIDVFFGLSEKLNATGGARVFFLGSREDTLERIRVRYSAEFPAVQIVGTYSPPFASEFTAHQLDEMVGAVNAAAPDVLWVAMTAPKQETWIHEVKHRLDVRFVAAIGAVFDFYAGTIQRSPPVFQRYGLEWLPRLLQEPRRLWRRTFVSAPVFVWHVLHARLAPGVRPRSPRRD